MYVYPTGGPDRTTTPPISLCSPACATHAAGAELVELAAFAGGAPALRLPRCFFAFGVGVEASVAATASVLVLTLVPGAVTSFAFGVG